jgi:hypothetical protein
MPGSPRPVRAVLGVIAVVGVVILAVVGVTTASSLASPVGHPPHTAKANATVTQTVTAYVTTYVTATATVTRTVTDGPTSSAPSSSAPTSSAPTSTAPTSSAPVTGWPNGSNTGVPAGTVLSPYSGSCTITTAATVIDSKSITCPNGLLIRAADVTITKSKVNGSIVVDTDVNRSWSLTLTDSEVAGYNGDLPAIYNGNVTLLRDNIHGGHNGLECQEHSSHCSLKDSWIHDQWQATTGDTHLGGILVLGNQVACTGPNGVCAELVHNTVVCDAPANVDGGGCTGDINLLPHYGPLPGALIQDNYLGANTGASFCTYGGDGMEYPASHIVYSGNVFARGTNRQCAAYGPVTEFDPSGAGNVWTGNTYSDGTTVGPS